ncbi:hypothetical protein [Aeromonas sp. 600948]|uniref:hypothetical protein n=1 Tax=Aeromonas sp. 600948 TaxID=2712034 RepID=UPI003BA21E81
MELNPYPDFFPEGVPSDAAENTSGEAYRLVKTNPPTPSDFQAFHLDKVNPKPVPSPSDCGTSMYRRRDVVVSLKAVSKPLKSRLIAIGTLEPHFGKMSKERSDSHFEAWLRINSGIENNFEVN